MCPCSTGHPIRTITAPCSRLPELRRARPDAAFEAVRAAVGAIDMSKHGGVHPRLGAADVIPFVPVDRVSLRGCAGIARVVGARIWEELKVPVYLYECAALRPECVRLEGVRKLARAGLAPDFGSGWHPTAGACVVGRAQVSDRLECQSAQRKS